MDFHCAAFVYKQIQESQSMASHCERVLMYISCLSLYVSMRVRQCCGELMSSFQKAHSDVPTLFFFLFLEISGQCLL